MLSQAVIYSDFDGTISTCDSLKELLDRFASPKWREYESAIKTRKMTEREALQKMFDLLDLSQQSAMEFIVDQIEIDPSFGDFTLWCQSREIPLFILSGGFGVFIKSILRKYELEHLSVIANEVEVRDGHWRIIPPLGARECDIQTHCKCASLSANSEKNLSIYIGDGHTDRCPAEKAHIRFAKGFLAESLKEKQIPYYEFENFNDIKNRLEKQKLCKNSAEK